MDRSVHQAALIVLLAGSAAAEPLIVAGDKGVVEVDEKGAIVRTLAQDSHARLPRWSKDRRRVYFLADRELRTVALDGTGEAVVATIPRSFAVCGCRRVAR